jgi:L-lysine exporter family protein LysE/ArgO
MTSIINFFSGIPVGFIMSFALGPIFFSLIHYSLTRGFWSSFYIATGVILADILLISTAFSGAQWLLPNDEKVKFWVSILGGLMLIGMGVSNFMKRKSDPKINEKSGKSAILLIFNGFLLNILNPANFFSWLILSANITQSGRFSMQGQFFFYTGCLVGIYFTEIAIAYFASLLQKYLNDAIMKKINYIMGGIFILCGLLLMASEW